MYFLDSETRLEYIHTISHGLLESAKIVLGNTRVVAEGVDCGVDDNERMKILCVLYKNRGRRSNLMFTKEPLNIWSWLSQNLTVNDHSATRP